MVTPRIKLLSSAVMFSLALIVTVGVLSLSAGGGWAAGPDKEARPADDTKALLEARAALAEKAYASAVEDLTRTRRFGNTLVQVGKPEDVYCWSVRWLHARQDLKGRLGNGRARLLPSREPLENRLGRSLALPPTAISRRPLSPRPEDQLAALEAHLKRMTELHEKVKQLHRDLLPQIAVDNAEWYRLEAKLWLARAKARQAKAR
jgi:hypothetical protein